MKMGNIVPRVGIEPTSLAFQAGVLLLYDVVLNDELTVNDRSEGSTNPNFWCGT